MDVDVVEKAVRKEVESIGNISGEFGGSLSIGGQPFRYKAKPRGNGVEVGTIYRVE